MHMNRWIAPIESALMALMHWNGRRVDQATVESGTDRLRLRFTEDGPIARRLLPRYVIRADPASGKRERIVANGLDFHSLIWERHDGSSWGRYRSISATRFQARSRNRQWVSDIHCFDAGQGTAILKIAEAHQQPGSPLTMIFYSWRKWDLRTNREMEFLRQCSFPTERYPDSGMPA